MTNQSIKKLCIDLATAESEEAVVALLRGAGFWENQEAWVDYDRNPNNFSTIGNQQSSPDAALVEKIINSVDAILMRECQRRGVKPDCPKAPKNIQEALKEYFGIFDGKLSSIDSSMRSELGDNILLVATGEKSNPCYSIIDFGEGQTPKRMPDTFLSLNKNNKLNVQFVQGKFNMGGTGALQFCSRKYNLQLIISKRDPEIAKNENDETKDYWGFTIVRREDPKEGMRSSSFRYLAPNGQILMFNAEYLPLLPGDYPQPYVNNIKWGTFIKLYEYQLPGLATFIKFNLFYRLSLLLPNIALPVKLYERRKGYHDPHKTYHIILSGLGVRLDEDKSENLEPDFPNSIEMRVMGQEMKVLLYVFKADKREHYSKKEGIVFTVNGQSQGFISQAFFERKSVGMSYLADSILVIVDCSKFERRIQEDLFMNSRDRLRDTPIRNEIEKRLEDLIKNHDGLKALREQRRKEEIENKLKDSKPFAEILENIIKISPSLSKLLLEGGRISNPFNLVRAKTITEYKGKKFPTYFRLSREYPEYKPKIAPINKRFRIQFETDAENEYFNRDSEPGKFSISFNNQMLADFSLNLWNGLASLNVALPDDAKIDDILHFQTETTDNSRLEPFYNEFFVKVAKPETPSASGPDKRSLPPGEKESSGKRKLPSGLSLPNIIELTKNDENWRRHFKNDDDALAVKDTGEGSYDFYVNMENIFLLTEIKCNTKIDPRLLQERFKYGLALLGLGLIYEFEKEPKRENQIENNGLSKYDEINFVSRAISPFLLPMIASLGDLEIN